MATPANTHTTPAEAARATFRLLFDERDIDAVANGYWTDDTADHFLAAGISVRGPHDLSDFFRELFAAVPDWRVEIENCFDDGENQAVVQWRGTGTFTGEPFLGIEATGRRVELRAVDVFRFDEDGKVETNTVYYDGAEFARQIGMLPPRDSAIDRGMLAAFNGATKLKRRLKN